MIDCMDSKDHIHGIEHVYRVLCNSIDIAQHMKAKVNYDILVAASLLHDIGRMEQNRELNLCHAQIGGEKGK